MTPTQVEGATQLGYNEETWDCFIHHYNSYLWNELETYSFDDHFRDLGWTESSWNGQSALPSTEAKWWGQLTAEEKTAAHKICYFEDNWDMIDMNPNDSIFPHPKPDFRFVPWDQLPSLTQDTAETALGYDELAWNELKTNIAEHNTFLNLDSAQREGALEIGFYTHSWDCWMNHYEAYFWPSFYGDLKKAIETLGWTENSWTEVDSPPASESTFWNDLTPEEKAAATQLCYFEETWNGDELSTFYDPNAPTGDSSKSSGSDSLESESDSTEAANSAYSALTASNGMLFLVSVGTYFLA